MTVLRPLNAVLLLIAAAAIAGPAWAVFVYEAPPPPLAGTVPDAPALARFQAMADEACRCARKASGDDGIRRCRTPYEAAIAPYAPGSMGSLCGPMSGEWACFDEACDASVTARRPLGACSNEEMRILIAIWEHEGGDTEEGWDRATAAVDRAISAFARGETVVAPPPSAGKSEGGGC